MQILVWMRSLLIISSDIVYAPAHAVIGDLCCELQSKEILVQRIYCHLIAEVCLEALRFSWLPLQGNICSPLANFLLKKSIGISLQSYWEGTNSFAVMLTPSLQMYEHKNKFSLLEHDISVVLRVAHGSIVIQCILVHQKMPNCSFGNTYRTKNYIGIVAYADSQWATTWFFSLVCVAVYKRFHGMYCSVARHDITTSNSASFFLRGPPYCLCLGGDMLYSSIISAHMASASLARKGLGRDAHFLFLGSSCSDSVLLIFETFDWRIAWPPPSRGHVLVSSYINCFSFFQVYLVVDRFSLNLLVLCVAELFTYNSEISQWIIAWFLKLGHSASAIMLKQAFSQSLELWHITVLGSTLKTSTITRPLVLLHWDPGVGFINDSWLCWKCFSLKDNFSWPQFVTRNLFVTSQWNHGLLSLITLAGWEFTSRYMSITYSKLVQVTGHLSSPYNPPATTDCIWTNDRGKIEWSLGIFLDLRNCRELEHWTRESELNLSEIPVSETRTSGAPNIKMDIVCRLIHQWKEYFLDGRIATLPMIKIGEAITYVRVESDNRAWLLCPEQFYTSLDGILPFICDLGNSMFLCG
ncbi:uncharacterized protein [Triticum aestivum]|uniref:uncharacterized protein n=1 Tax=Triticum aestivum TaxID=4565 RepID=UPI00098AC79C|nr:uncharacterized protein LOC109787633 [Aegilops tauschii subsp. strangulata]XP_040252376.1 uncharacterized protein LOC109787633 [Aegilops tauschii subsp. strangulata]XP_040252377.1 uncharacterized protein LOC109787633 [Aegilops tauschii subsp. strangulata]XP_040252379.1 uncharacterized protein LOC109787633 [Aegilops tauschii subsp. strangulata]XP_040252380.1 uncharacterized protein LOC109787633 [Aegilops tauschii subsp. strangulata]XP_040252381.1 uncharacterized protein LOC109787633 [Aegilop